MLWAWLPWGYVLVIRRLPFDRARPPLELQGVFRAAGRQHVKAQLPLVGTVRVVDARPDIPFRLGVRQILTLSSGDACLDGHPSVAPVFWFELSEEGVNVHTRVTLSPPKFEARNQSKWSKKVQRI